MQTRLKRLTAALALALVLLISTIEPVTAQAAETSGWIELLEYSSIQHNGENWFTVYGTNGTVTIPVQGEKRLRKVDVLLWNPAGQRFSTASCTVGGKTTNLEVLAIGGNLTRIVGYIPDAFYESITIDLKKGTTSSQTYEVLSWKVTPVGVQEFVADASVYVESFGESGSYTTGYNIPLGFDYSGAGSDGYPYLARIDVRDWEKYDSLSIWGSATWASIESIRASIDTTALDIEVNFIDAESYETCVDGDPTYWETAQWGKYLFNITIDLSGVDRSLTNSLLLVYITGSYDMTVEAFFNCQFVNGSVTTADTSAVSWWHRFTSFFTDLLGGEDRGGDNFAGQMEQQAQDMEQAVEDMNQVARPPVSDIDVSIDAYVEPYAMAQVGTIVTGLMNNSLVMAMTMISMILALAAYVVFGKR